MGKKKPWISNVTVIMLWYENDVVVSMVHKSLFAHGVIEAVKLEAV